MYEFYLVSVKQDDHIAKTFHNPRKNAPTSRTAKYQSIFAGKGAERRRIQTCLLNP